MSSTQQLRQSDLFAGQVWQSVYQAFSNVNLQSYDYDTLRAAIVASVQTNYPEEFNDWVQSSEFVMIINAVAYLGQSLAFRTDLNTRENFLDTAERRSSILKLAKMLGYAPNRNFPARGLVKITTVTTDQPLQDSQGNQLANVTITWNDATNDAWQEQFTDVLNAAFTVTNPFGLPQTSTLVGGIVTQLYGINNQPFITVADAFDTNIANVNTPFEIVNAAIDALGFFTEATPDPEASKHVIYRNDGAGNGSINTGFFGYFKQGTLQNQDFYFDQAVANRIIDIDVANINALDVWVQNINADGSVISTWQQVSSTQNLVFNSINQQQRNIYAVISRAQDQISIKFGDGAFASAPVGLFRVWFRTSNALTYNIATADMNNISITIPYIANGNATQIYNLTLTYALQYGIASTDVGASLPAESMASIQNNASQVYYTQNRMVNGQDYNAFPLQFGNAVVKIQAVNRIYSGQSRYIDNNDPTGMYQDTMMFGEDGMLYSQNYARTSFVSLPTNLSGSDMVVNNIQPLLSELDLQDFFHANTARILIDGQPLPTKWVSTGTANTAGGIWVDALQNGTYVPQAVGLGQSNGYVYLATGALVKFQDPNTTSNVLWAQISQVVGNGIASSAVGAITLSSYVPSNFRVIEVVPSIRSNLTATETSIVAQCIVNKTTFALRYAAATNNWLVVTANNIDFADAYSTVHAGDASNGNLDASWLLLAQYLPGQGYWQFSTRNLQYIFESVSDTRFYFIDTDKIVDATSNLALRDYIKVLKVNSQPSPVNTALGTDMSFNLLAPIVYADGFIEPRRVQVTFSNTLNTGIAANPDTFNAIVDPQAQIVGSSPTTRLVFHQAQTTGAYTEWVPTTAVTAFTAAASINAGSLATGAVGYALDTKQFYLMTASGTTQNVSTSYAANPGRSGLYFQWKHYAPQDNRIDPATTNVIDIYVLLTSYYQAVQNWLSSTATSAFPTPPTSDAVRSQLQTLEQYGMMTDQIIWHPASFKLLFGSTAASNLQANFVVVPAAGSVLTNNDIQQRVIACVNAYFSVGNWAFGETFYATELLAYIHQQLSGIVASVVLVAKDSTQKFGTLFEIRCETQEIFISTAQVTDVTVVSDLTQTNLNIGN